MSLFEDVFHLTVSSLKLLLRMLQSSSLRRSIRHLSFEEGGTVRSPTSKLLTLDAFG